MNSLKHVTCVTSRLERLPREGSARKLTDCIGRFSKLFGRADVCGRLYVEEWNEGTLRFHEWIGDGWAILFSHPKDYTPVCTTELGYMARIAPEFTKRNCKIIGLSVDPDESHKEWAKDIQEAQGAAVNYPMIADTNLHVSKLYNMLPAEEGDSCDGRTAATNQTVRSLFIVGPDKKVKLMLTYPMTTGRIFDEILRVLDSMKLTAKHRVATPANWKNGDDVIIAGSVSDEDAKKAFPSGWKAVKPYLRIVKQPKQVHGFCLHQRARLHMIS